ncbi:hypothetical protein [Terrimonas alba]
MCLYFIDGQVELAKEEYSFNRLPDEYFSWLISHCGFTTTG